MQGYITGLEKPVKAMVLMIAYYAVFRIPAAIILQGTMSLTGIWVAFLVSHILAFVLAIVLTLSTLRKRK